MTDREYTIKFIDWTLAIMRLEWTAADGNKEEQRKWFDRINQALDRRCDMMKLIAYDDKITKPKPVAVPKAKAKPKVDIPQPPSPMG